MARFWILLVVMLIPWVLGATPVGTLNSLEGDVTVLRSGVLIPSEKVGEGFAVEAFDTLATGTTGRADFRFTPSTGLTGSLHLDPESAFYLDLSPRKTEQTAGVELLQGAVSVRLTSVVGASLVEVRTETGSFSGSGPWFRVVGALSGDNLVTCTAGKVYCRSGAQTLSVEPGTVLEAQTLDQRFQTHEVNVSTLGSYETAWIQQKRQTFRDQVAVYFRVLGSRYQLQVGHFQRAWDRVQTEPKDDLQGLRAATANLRRSAFPLERSVFRIQALRKLADDGVLSPVLELTRGYPAKDFFRQTVQDEAQWFGRLAQSRGLYKTLADRNGGTFPLAADGSAVTYDSNFFQ